MFYPQQCEVEFFKLYQPIKVYIKNQPTEFSYPPKEIVQILDLVSPLVCSERSNKKLLIVSLSPH